MNCFLHPNRYAVAQCVDCHKGLCQQCASKYTIPICDTCNNKRCIKERIEYTKPITICIILYIIGYHIELLGPDRHLGAYMLMSAYAGWKFINKFLPTFFVWFSLRSIFMFYLLKLSVSMVIGFFTTPLYMVYSIYKFVHTFL